MENNSLNPLNRSGTPLVPLVFTQMERWRFAAGHRDASAVLVCDDLLAGRDPAWQLARYAVLDAFCRAHMEQL